jgi:tripartite-type tricarboxylate transporter receptor subunit TctC
MKKLNKFIGGLAILLTVTHTNAETIAIQWGFLSGPAFNNLHHIVTNANASQAKYNFIIENKVGAAGLIATRHVLNNHNTALVAQTPLGFVLRGIQNNSYNLNDFQPIAIQFLNIPLILVSKKYRTVEELIDSKNPINIAVSGIGGTTDYVAKTLVDNLQNAQVISFKGIPDSLNSVLGGHTDAGVMYYSSAKQFIDNGMLYILGYTGNTQPKFTTVKPFKFYGDKDLSNVTFGFALYGSIKMDKDRAIELNKILTNAAIQPNALSALEFDEPMNPKLFFDKLQDWHDKQRKFWEPLAFHKFK